VKLPLYQVDAFASQVFRGNPAAVCPLEEWIDDALMQSIAAENNLSETAFFVGADGTYRLRWFTPRVEVDLCGHATLGSGYVVFRHLEPEAREVRFESKSGPLTVTRDGPVGRTIWLDFPARPPRPAAAPADAEEALGARPLNALATLRDYLFELASEAEVRELRPDFRALAKWDRFVIVTAAGSSADFVSRFFAPSGGIDEDPVTGSAHCTLTPFWAERSGRTKLRALQLSERGGELACELAGERVRIGGEVRPYLEGTIEV
jgi:PhzF family phenazine biosynthesis protein